MAHRTRDPEEREIQEKECLLQSCSFEEIILFSISLFFLFGCEGCFAAKCVLSFWHTSFSLYPAFCIEEKNDLQLLGNLEWIQSSETEY